MDAGKQPAQLEAALSAQVHQGESYVGFGELTVAEVEGRAAELGSVGSWGPLQRAAKVSRAWADLGRIMRERGAATVADLDAETIVKFAEYTWVLPPPIGMT
jgi:hypothetical protein